jgi:hypothetical protein
MKIFKDNDLKNEIIDLDLGIVEAGTSEKFTFYVYNDQLPALINLEFIISSPEVKIISSPKELKYKESGELIIEYSPLVTLKQGLKTNIEISGFELYK